MKKMLRTLLLCWAFCVCLAPAAFAKTILYVPADDRPVSLEYCVDTVKAAGFDILTPPVENIAGRFRQGDPEKLWQWVKDNAGKADALVLSGDTLIYGGLVDSRVHDFASVLLEWRLKHFRELRQAVPGVPLYVFNTVMRSPHASAGGVEPPYYEKYGPDIFTVTSLQDKAETAGLSEEEKTRLRLAKARVPQEDMQDWLDRRAKNYKINEAMLGLTREKVVDFFILGRDDTSPFSQSHKESRQLNKLAENLTNQQYVSFPGADQLGILLLARAYNHLAGQTPKVAICYAFGSEGKTVASYEDQAVGRGIIDHIIAAGGTVVRGGQPDLILAVNTPLDGHTAEAEEFDNLPMVTASLRQFAGMVGKNIDGGRRVAVADIAFANGADNSLMAELGNEKLLDRLSAYSGWNTASNTIGFAIGQGMMASTTSDQERKRLLLVRYLEDWGYQANLRKEIYRETFLDSPGDPQQLGALEQKITLATEKKIRLFASQYLWGEPERIHVSYPWSRMFEIGVSIDKTSKPVVKTEQASDKPVPLKIPPSAPPGGLPDASLAK